MAETPAVKDLPKLADNLKGELEKDHNLKKTEVRTDLYDMSNRRTLNRL